MSRKHRFGIIGCGVIAPFHAESIKAADNAEITAVCDIIEEKAADFANKYSVAKYYTDYRQLIDDEDVDIVCICTPSGMHGEMCIYAANAGKNIFCEKPMEITREKIDAVIEAVEKNGVKMACVFQKRTEQVYIEVKRAVDEGRFGSLVLADAYLKYYRSQAYYDSAGWRGTWELDGGGALMNQGVHGIDLLMWIAGDVDSVFARAAAKARNIDVEDTAVAVLKFKNGAFGVLEGTTSVYPGQPCRLEIHGKDGSVVFGDEGITRWGIENMEEGKIPGSSDNLYSASSNPGAMPKQSHLVLIQDLMDAIENNREPLIPPREARKAVDLILAIYESAKTGKEIFL